MVLVSRRQVMTTIDKRGRAQEERLRGARCAGEKEQPGGKTEGVKRKAV